MSKIEEKPKELSKNLFPVVGVGASAGGLDSFRKLLHAIPGNSGMAFIIVQHLHPEHKSSLVEILQRDTDIPVIEITDRVKVEPNYIYVIPSNKLVNANDGMLELSDRPKNEKNMPIDIFFTSLADVHQSHAIGVVLSGFGNDGTIGLKSIRDAGGLTIAEDPASAAYDIMPVSAISENVVDFVLPAEEIPKKLLSLRDTLSIYLGNHDSARIDNDEESFKQILALLRVRKTVDFTYYKQTTIRRRILRRMLLLKLEKLEEYQQFLKKNTNEQDHLFQDLLIPVTHFFRDPTVFTALCDEILPLITKGKTQVNPLRIWIAGCSTGQEAYSYGICLHEVLGDKLVDMKIQIFATDLSSKAIAFARAGVYSKKELHGLSEQRLQRFFYKTDGHYQISKAIRDMFIFSPHNFLKDPPFANLDLVSCRNVLIYLEPFLQKKALHTFHYSLKEKAVMVLGKSETIGNNTELFAPLKKTEKIYQKKISPLSQPAISTRREKNYESFKPVDKPMPAKDSFQKTVDELLLAEFTPAGVVVNEQLEIVQFRGSTGKFLEPSPGRASLNVLKMAKEGLSFEIRNAIHKAKPAKERVIKTGIVLRKSGLVADIEVIPLANMIEPHYLILFKETAQNLDTAYKDGPGDRSSDGPMHDRIQILEKELSQTREDMRSITEDQEAANEELQSANEELLSGSEELQSLNEELESSKEELQSTNEELLTVNQELFERTELYNKARLYAEGIVSTIHEPLLVMDADLRIKTANNSFLKNFDTREEEVYGVHLFSLQDGIWATDLIRHNILKLTKNEALVLEWEDALVTRKGVKKILCFNAQPVFRGSGEQLYLLAMEDITLKKEAETKIIRFNQELEQQVTERTNSLKEINIELTHSNKNLEQFASIASHDLQEPLRKIQTFGKLLHVRHAAEISTDAKELVDKIVTSAERMANLIKDVLSFYRMSQPDAFQETNLNSLINEVLKDFDLLIAENQAQIKVEKLPVLEVIPLQINQLFYNLLSNSFKFSKPDLSPVIEISSKKLTPQEITKYGDLNADTSYFEITFKDNGIGFDQEYATQIFLIFQRLHVQANYEGTGIGLALCEKIINNHHGLIRAQGKENEGATFFIILPEKQPTQ